MSSEKFKVGNSFKLAGELVTIISRNKGTKTTKVDNGTFGLKSRPCSYTLSNGKTMKGYTLIKLMKEGVLKKA